MEAKFWSLLDIMILKSAIQKTLIEKSRDAFVKRKKHNFCLIETKSSAGK